jgi:hypothetical protein
VDGWTKVFGAEFQRVTAFDPGETFLSLEAVLHRIARAGNCAAHGRVAHYVEKRRSLAGGVGRRIIETERAGRGLIQAHIEIERIAQECPAQCVGSV